MGRSHRWLACVSLIVTAAAQQQSRHCNNTINSMRMRHSIDSVVQVRSPSREPLGEAASFLLPSSGPSATFGESALSLTIQTDHRGMAVGRGLLLNRIEGQFRIRATASWRGGISAKLMQTNTETQSASSRSKWVAILEAPGGAALGDIVLARRDGRDSTPRSIARQDPGSDTIAPGGPSFGSPR